MQTLLFILIALSLSWTAHADPGLELIEDAFVPITEIINSKLEKKSRECRQTRVTLQTPDPLNLDQFRQIEYVDYQPFKASHRTLIMMPPTGGVSLVDRRLAQKLCEEQVRVFLHYHFTDDAESSLDPSIHEKAFVRGLTAIKHMALNIEDKNFGIIGTSLGALYSSQALVVEPRIDRALLVVGGAPIVDILSTSEQEVLKELRQKRMGQHGLKTTEEYKKFLSDRFRLDLLSRLKPAQDVNVWKVRSLDDDTVPTFTQTQLIDLLEPLQITDSKAGHTRSIFNLLFEQKKIVDFFKQ